MPIDCSLYAVPKTVVYGKVIKIQYHIEKQLYFRSKTRTKIKIPKANDFSINGKGLIIINIGYARVSKHEQNLDRQTDALNSAGVTKLYTEKVTGKKTDRPELMKMIDHLREGDVVIISELTRLSRSTKDLFMIVELIQSKGADIKSLKEAWLDTTTPHGKLMFTIFAGLSQFEADLIAQRTREGLEAARQRGRLGGRPKVDTGQVEKALKLYHTQKYTLREIEDLTGIKKSTLYRSLDKEK